MELSNLGADLIGTHEAAILRVLARTTSLSSGRQVERLTGLNSHSGTQRALLRLEKIGLVTAIPNLATIAYQLNRDHILWPPFEQILSSRPRIDEAIVNAVTSTLTPAVAASVTVAVFGSYARGDARADSDIDVLVVFPDDLEFDSREEVGWELHEKVGRLVGNPIQVFDVQRHDLARMIAASDPLVDSWRRDARYLAGPRLELGRGRAAA